jgi:nicotinamidase-related amidase
VSTTIDPPDVAAPGGIGPVAGTTPYPWPYDGSCTGPRLALVVAGWDRGWRRRVTGPGAAAVESSLIGLASAVAAAGGTVVTLAHLGPPRLARLGRGPASVPDPVPVPDPGDPPGLPEAEHHTTAGLDGFWGSGLDAALRAVGATHLLVAGHGLEGPVHSTMRGANDQGYECLLVLDAATPLVADLVAPSRSMIEMSGGIFGAVGLAADVLAALRPVPATAPTPPEAPGP